MKKLLFILMLISIVSNCLAQVVSTTDLCNTEWVLRSPNCDGCKKFIAFTLSHKTDKVFFVEKQKTYNNKFDYYISPTIPKVFDKALVGKESKGKYIIQEVFCEVFWFEIQKLTKDELILHSKLGGTFCYSKK